jgi:hypothetical protein
MKGCYIFFFFLGGGNQCFHEKQVDITDDRLAEA